MAVIFEDPHHIAELATLITREFSEMPGLNLTEAQIRRWWSLSAPECHAVLECVVSAHQLVVDGTGRYRKPD